MGRFSRPVAGAPPDKIGGAFRGLLFSEAPRAQNWGGAARGAPRGGAEARRHYPARAGFWRSRVRFNGRVFRWPEVERKSPPLTTTTDAYASSNR